MEYSARIFNSYCKISIYNIIYNIYALLQSLYNYIIQINNYIVAMYIFIIRSTINKTNNPVLI